MADFRARQRVQIHDGTDEFAVVSSKPIFVQLSDGTDVALINASGQLAVEVGNTVTIQDGGNVISIDDNGGSITVDGTVSISGSVTVTATDLDIRDLTHVSDSVKVGDGTDFLAIAADGSIAVTDNGTTLSVDDGGGSITVDGSVTVSATDLDIRDLTHVSDSVKIGDGTDLLAVNADGSINVVVAASSGTKVHDYNTVAAVAKDATSNHDYTVTATKTLKLRQIIVASSGAMKITVQVGPVASLVTKAVIFTSGAKPMETITFDVPIDVPDTSTGTVRLIRRNDDNSAMDVYSTIIGEEV